MSLNLKKIRITKGIKQSEIAEAFGVSESAVSHWENGRFMPSTQKLTKLAAMLDCTVDELLETTEIEDERS